MNTLRAVQQLLVEEFGLQSDQVAPETRFSELGVDSLAKMEFVFLLEDRFELAVSELPVTVATVGGMAEHIDFLLAQQRSSAREDATGDR
jgi:acyl carrier protein